MRSSAFLLRPRGSLATFITVLSPPVRRHPHLSIMVTSDVRSPRDQSLGLEAPRGQKIKSWS